MSANQLELNLEANTQMKELKEEINYALSAGTVRRYHTDDTLRSQNDAEHSFNAALIAWRVGLEEPGIHPDLAIRILLLHDLGEKVVGDVSHNAKRDNPELNKLLHEAEQKAIKDNLPQLSLHLEISLEKDGNKHRDFCSIIDTLEAYYFGLRDYESGNLAGRKIMVAALRGAFAKLQKSKHHFPVLKELIDELCKTI